MHLFIHFICRPFRNFLKNKNLQLFSVKTNPVWKPGNRRLAFPGRNQKASYLFDLSNCALLLAVITPAVSIQSLRNEISIMKCNINALNASAVEPNQFHSGNFSMRNYWNYWCPYLYVHICTIHGRECGPRVFGAVRCLGNCGHFSQLKALHILQSIYEIIK